MHAQDVINLLGAVICVLLGYVLNGVRNSVATLHQADTDLTNRVQAVELLVAGNYVTRDEHQRAMDRLFAKLESIDDKLSTKADK